MTTQSAMVEKTVGSSTAANRSVWQRLWRHEPSPTKDDRLIERERRNPRWSMFVDALRETFGTMKGIRTIELGSGRGDLSVLLACEGANVTLVDVSEAGLDQARRRFQRLGLTARFERGDMLGDLGTLRHQFDVSLSSGVIEHFRGNERARVVAAHHDVVRPGGLTMISVPNAWCPPYRLWKRYLELRGWWPYGMEIPYSKKELTRLARSAGFRRVKTRCMGFWQSVGDHCGKGLLGRRVDWVDKPSLLDETMGMTLVMMAWR